jgi:tetratricopeptide (TPR) repeat protein
MRFDELGPSIKKRLPSPASGRGESSGWAKFCGVIFCSALLGACSLLRPSAPESAAPDTATASAAPAAPSPAPAAAPAAAASEAAAPGAKANETAGAAPAAPAGPPVDPVVRAAFSEAVAALQAGHDDEAQKDFIALARADPELAGPHANLGILYRRAGKADEAVAELEIAVKLGAAQAPYWNQLGIAYRQQGRFDKAREAYERAIGLDPKYAMAKLNLGVLFDLYLWDAAHALEQYEQYLSLTPGGDEKVSKWIADLRNRARAQAAAGAPAGGKERE